MDKSDWVPVGWREENESVEMQKGERQQNKMKFEKRLSPTDDDSTLQTEEWKELNCAPPVFKNKKA